MPFLAQIIIAIISFAIAYMLRPKLAASDTTTNPESAEFPSVAEGVEVPVFFGIVWSSDATLVWWGDLELKEGEQDV